MYFCPSQAGIVSKRLNRSRSFSWHTGLVQLILTLYCKEIWVSVKIRVLPLELVPNSGLHYGTLTVAGVSIQQSTDHRRLLIALSDERDARSARS